MIVKLSGGEEKTRNWGSYDGKEIKTKKMAEKLIRQHQTGVKFVDRGPADFVVIPDHVNDASDSAKRTGGRVVHLGWFLRQAMLSKGEDLGMPVTSRKKHTLKKTRSTRKKVSTKKKKTSVRKKKTGTKKKKTQSKKKTSARRGGSKKATKKGSKRK